jgi:drug/metabolite transporter (DMT)-like permease
VDSAGVHLAPPWLYGWAMWTGTALLLNLWIRLRPGRGSRSRARAPVSSAARADREAAGWGRAAAVGVPMVTAYLLVLVALRLAPLVVVAPIRESAIVLVTGWSIWRLGERRDAWLRLTGTVGVLLGVVLVAV